MKKRIFLLLVIAILTGCTTTGSWHSERDYECRVLEELVTSNQGRGLGLWAWYECMTQD